MLRSDNAHSLGSVIVALFLFFIRAILLKDLSPEQLVIINDRYMRKATETLGKVLYSSFSCNNEICASGEWHFLNFAKLLHCTNSP